MRRAFTMVEMVFVIVITGLVAVAGSMAIVQIMQNYAIQKEYAKMEQDSTSAILQISKYLQDSIWDSIALKQGSVYTGIFSVNSESSGKVTGNTLLAFITKNADVLNGYFGDYQGNSSNLPLFSGFIDLSKSSGTTIVTAFSQDKLRSINVNNLGLYFPFVNQDGNVYNKYYSGNKTALFQINAIQSDSTMQLSRAPSKIGDIAVIVNMLEATIQKNNDNDLIFSHNGQSITLAQNVSRLSVWSESQSGILRVRICFVNKTMDFMPEFCKEGVIMQ